MSTNYYLPKPPITSMRLRTEGPHDKLSIFTRGKLAGELVLDDGDGRDFIYWMLRREPLLHAYFGGEKNGMMVEPCNPGMVPPDAMDRSVQIFSESGEACTIGELLDNRGSGKKEG